MVHLWHYCRESWSCIFSSLYIFLSIMSRGVYVCVWVVCSLVLQFYYLCFRKCARSIELLSLSLWSLKFRWKLLHGITKGILWVSSVCGRFSGEEARREWEREFLEVGQEEKAYTTTDCAKRRRRPISSHPQAKAPLCKIPQIFIDQSSVY